MKIVEDDNILRDLNKLCTHEIEIFEDIAEGGIFYDFTLNDTEYQTLDLIEKNSVRYICGYLICKCLSKHSCTVCEDYSIDHVELEDSAISCFFKVKVPFSNLKMSHNFIFYISYLEVIFNNDFERVILKEMSLKHF